MFFYSGWYYCTQDNWTGTDYDSRNLVSIEEYNDTYGTKDFTNLITERRDFDDEGNRLQIKTLDPKAVSWLLKNVLDDPKTGEKGWCMGNEDYNSTGGSDFSLWFYRRRDAMSFIKEWSVYKKPTETYNQNSYVKKKLNLDTNTLQVEVRE